jgi:hypothetical protein
MRPRDEPERKTDLYFPEFQGAQGHMPLKKIIEMRGFGETKCIGYFSDVPGAVLE